MLESESVSHSVVSDSLQSHGLSMEFSRPEYRTLPRRREADADRQTDRQTDTSAQAHTGRDAEVAKELEFQL